MLGVDLGALLWIVENWSSPCRHAPPGSNGIDEHGRRDGEIERQKVFWRPYVCVCDGKCTKRRKKEIENEKWMGR